MEWEGDEFSLGSAESEESVGLQRRAPKGNWKAECGAAQRGLGMPPEHSWPLAWNDLSKGHKIRGRAGAQDL